MKTSREILKIDGRWVNRRQDNTGLSTMHRTRGAAIAAGREMLENEGGGELYIRKEDGTLNARICISMPFSAFHMILSPCKG